MPDCEFTFKCSYLEIYNEVITDLLNPQKTNLKIHETVDKGVFVGDITEEIVNHAVQAYGLVLKGEENRHSSATNMNEHSSRSHTIFRIAIERLVRNRNGSEVSRTNAVLTFVDLAGSERAGYTGAEGVRLKEGGHINKSLLALATVISKLSRASSIDEGVGTSSNDQSNNNALHIPFRNSKLTRILQPSLGGNARTAIICGITPASEYAEETLGTLKFAASAKKVRNAPIKNEFITMEEQLSRYKAEIDRLRSLLANVPHDRSFIDSGTIEIKSDQSEEDSVDDRNFDGHGSPSSKRLRLSDEKSLKEEAILEASSLLNLLNLIKELPHDILGLQNIVKSITEDATCSLDDIHSKVHLQFTNLIEQLKFAQTERDGLISACKEMEARDFEQQARISQVEAQLINVEAFKQETNIAEAKLKALEEETIQMTKVWHEMEDSLMDQLARLDAERESLAEKLRQIQEKPDAQNQITINPSIDIIVGELEGAVDRLIANIPDTDSIEMSYARRIDEIEREKEKLSIEHSNLKIELDNRQKDIDELLGRIGKMQHEANNQSHIASAELDRLQSENDAIKQKLSLAEEVKDFALNEQTKLKEQLDLLRIQLNNSEHMCKEGQAREDRATELMEDLKQQLVQLEELLGNERTTRKALEAEKVWGMEQVGLLRERIFSLEAERDKSLNELNKSRFLREANEAKASAEVVRLTAELEAFQSRTEELQHLLTEASKARVAENSTSTVRISELEDLLRTFESSKKDLEEEVSRLQGIINSKHAEYIALQADLENVKNDFHNQIIVLLNEKQTMESRYENCKGDLEAKIEILEASIKSQNGELEVLGEEKERLRRVCEKLRDQVDHLETEAADASSVSSSVLKERDQLKSRIDILEQDLVQAKAEAVKHDQASSKAEIMLRVEVDRLKDMVARERRLAALKVEDAEERLGHALSRIAELEKTKSVSNPSIFPITTEAESENNFNRENRPPPPPAADVNTEIKQSTAPPAPNVPAPECLQQ